MPQHSRAELRLSRSTQKSSAADGIRHHQYWCEILLNTFDLVDRIQHLVPSFDGGDDAVRIGGPDEGLRFCVVLADEAVDGGLEVDDGAEDAALEPALGELGEEAFDGVEPGAGCRHEVEGPARVAVEPLAHLGVLVRGVVVEDGVDVLAGRDLRLRWR